MLQTELNRKVLEVITKNPGISELGIVANLAPDMFQLTEFQHAIRVLIEINMIRLERTTLVGDYVSIRTQFYPV